MRFAVLCAFAICCVPAAAAPAPCITSQLDARLDTTEGYEIAGGLGHQATIVEIRNHSSLPCSLQGTPGLTFFDVSGNPFPDKACPNCGDYLFGRQPAGPVTLEAGSKADCHRLCCG